MPASSNLLLSSPISTLSGEEKSLFIKRNVKEWNVDVKCAIGRSGHAGRIRSSMFWLLRLRSDFWRIARGLFGVSGRTR
jgi:hypothetical protein